MRPRQIWTGTQQPERLLWQLWCVSKSRRGAKPKCPTFYINWAGIIFEFSLYFTEALSAFLKWNNSEIGYSRCLFSSLPLTHTHVLHTFSTHTQTNPCLSRHHFFFFCIFFFLFFFFPRRYETLDRQCSAQLSAIPIQTQSDKMVTLSAHWQFIPN